MISVLIQLLVVLLVVGVIWWLLDYLPVPEPLNRIAKVIVIVVGAIILVVLLLNVAGVNTGISVRP